MKDPIPYCKSTLKSIEHKNEVPTSLGQGGQSVRKRFSQKVLPISQHASQVYRITLELNNPASDTYAPSEFD